jgi:tRNA (mo5U34)-methyltransferase
MIAPEKAILRMSRVLAAGNRLRNTISELKRHHTVDFEWYPHDSLSNVVHMERLFSVKYEPLLTNGRTDGVLDIGSQDGELSFLFESLGCRVTSVDQPATNHNGMRGMRALKELLNSSIDIHEVDLDSQFKLPDERYGLTLFLGVLYHLKNPFYVLERVAKHSKYCLLSTRIARCLPDGSRMPPNSPLGYLLDVDELNHDNTNYWIFSDAGLRRLLKRTQWELLESFSVGDTSTSDPTSLDRDERVFCLLKSHFGLANVELMDGWHGVEVDGWRWTKQHFSVRVGFDAASNPNKIIVRLFVPPVLLEHLGPVKLSANVDGRELQPVTLDRAGNYEFARRFRAEGDHAVMTFSLDKALSPEDGDGRELGLVVASIDVE